MADVDYFIEGTTRLQGDLRRIQNKASRDFVMGITTTTGSTSSASSPNIFTYGPSDYYMSPVIEGTWSTTGIEASLTGPGNSLDVVAKKLLKPDFGDVEVAMREPSSDAYIVSFYRGACFESYQHSYRVLRYTMRDGVAVEGLEQNLKDVIKGFKVDVNNNLGRSRVRESFYTDVKAYPGDGVKVYVDELTSIDCLVVGRNDRLNEIEVALPDKTPVLNVSPLTKVELI